MDIGTLVTSWIAISAVVTAATTYLKSVLTQFPGFADPKNAGILSLVLQTAAFFIGAVSAYAAQLNVLAAFPPFAAAPPIAGYILIGFASLLGGQGGYILLSILAGRVVPSPAIPAQTVDRVSGAVVSSPETTVEYSPFVVHERTSA